jgi:hypothetical protein
MTADSFHLAAFLWRKFKIKSLFASMISFIRTTVVPKIFPVTLIRKLALKVVQKAGFDMLLWKKNKNSDAAFRTIFKINKCFQRSKDKLFICFSLSQGSLKI